MTQTLVDKVVELRRRTDESAMVCRKALARQEWDLDKAEVYIREGNIRKHPIGMLITRKDGLHGN